MKKVIQSLRKFAILLIAMAGMFAITPPAHAAAENSVQVVEAFNQANQLTPAQLKERDLSRRQIMFVMGIPLLIMLLATAVLGIAMGVYGKKVFVAHLVVASLSLTLAVIHVIVGFVWFFPF